MKRIELSGDADIYDIKVNIKSICAQQDEEFDTRIEKTTTGFEKTLTTVKTEMADDKIKDSPLERKRKSKRTDIHSYVLHNFPRVDGFLIANLGGTYGLLKSTLNKAVNAIGMAEYKKPSIAFIRFYPEIINLCKESDATIKYQPVLEPRSRGTTREKVYYERIISSFTVDIKMAISKVCPLTGKEIGALIQAIVDYDGFGASGRGQIASIEIINSD